MKLVVNRVYKKLNESEIVLYFAKHLNVQFFTEIDCLGTCDIELTSKPWGTGFNNKLNTAGIYLFFIHFPRDI